MYSKKSKINIFFSQDWRENDRDFRFEHFMIKTMISVTLSFIYMQRDIHFLQEILCIFSQLIDRILL